MNDFSEKVSSIWSVADLLRGPYRPNQYKDAMLPMTVLRWLDCVLEPSKEQVLAPFQQLESSNQVQRTSEVRCTWSHLRD